MSAELNPKAVAAAIKDGGKKGVDIAGINEMGGIAFFVLNFDNSAKGDPELLKKCLEGANTPVDEEAEERKGGAQNLGKVFVTGNDDRAVALLNLPAAVKDVGVTLEEWAEVYMKYPTSELTKIDDQTVLIVTKAAPEKDVYPIKIKDDYIAQSFIFLRGKGVIPPPEDPVDFGEMEELEW